MVVRPRAAKRGALLGPIPGRRETGRGARKAAPPSGGTSSWPSGFAESEAIFATSLQAAMPADAGRPSSSAIRRRSRAAISAAEPSSLREAVTSRNASSSESGSQRGVALSRMSNTRSLTAA